MQNYFKVNLHLRNCFAVLAQKRDIRIIGCYISIFLNFFLSQRFSIKDLFTCRVYVFNSRAFGALGKEEKLVAFLWLNRPDHRMSSDAFIMVDFRKHCFLHLYVVKRRNSESAWLEAWDSLKNMLVIFL